MTLFYYGSNKKWDHLLDSLFNDLKKYGVMEIKHVTDVSDITNIDTNIILPLMEHHMIELHNNNIKGLMPNKNIVETFRNKRLFYDYVIKYKLQRFVPITHTSLKTITGNLLIVKPVNLCAGKGIYTTNKVTNALCEKYIVQDYIRFGTEYVAHTVAKNGKIVHTIVYEDTKGKGVYIKTGVINTYGIKRVNIDKKYIKILEMFLRPCSYTGVCTIDFKLDKLGNLKVFEINPRLGGSLMFIEHKKDLIEIIGKLISVF